MNIKLTSVDSNFEREPLLRPFGFKGGYMSEIWQTVAGMASESGHRAAGINTQSILWSDAEVFLRHSEPAGNSLMFAMTEFALKQAESISFKTPVELLEKILPETYRYGKKITGRDDLRLTFALNALVGIDAAAWILYARQNNFRNFDEMIPEKYRAALGWRHGKIACIPLMSYAVPLPEVIEHVDKGFFFLKVKIGSDPDRDGDPEKMLDWDKQRVREIHEAIGQRETPYTENGKIPYYFDANGRYDTIDRLRRFLDFTRKIGAFDQIAIIEEPFPEEYTAEVGDLGVRVAADESAHCVEDVNQRIELGYGAIALKPIAKTLSMTLKIAELAHKKNIPMFCADLTVGPIQVDWNKTFAARIAPLPGMKIGVVETNGHQNYRNWSKLTSYHPVADAPWIKPHDGCFDLPDRFFEESGGILADSKHYMDLLTDLTE